MRPGFHLTTPHGWMNDPVGITWRDGRYHVFFQQVTGSLEWAPACEWGHATTTDFVGWEHLPTALVPGEDDDGCWSGCVLPADPDRPEPAALLYSAVSTGRLGVARVRVATPEDDGWARWAKGEVVVTAPEELDLAEFRDPTLLRDGDRWLMLVGAGLVDGTACVLGFSSRPGDLLLSPSGWTYAGVVASRDGARQDPMWTGHAWECPQLVSVGDRHVLLVSVWSGGVTQHVVAAIGTYTDGRFEAAHWQRLGYGPGPYAATSFTDESGGTAVMMWLREIAGPPGAPDGWAGAQSVPMLLDVVEDRVVLSVHPALALRTVPASGEELSHGWDVTWRVRPGGVVQLVSEAGATVLTLSAGDGHVEVAPAAGEPELVPCTAETVRVLVDGPVLEVFTGGAVHGCPLDTGGAPLRVHHTGDGDLDRLRVLSST